MLYEKLRQPKSEMHKLMATFGLAKAASAKPATVTAIQLPQLAFPQAPQPAAPTKSA